jgi:hypothetical protein
MVLFLTNGQQTHIALVFISAVYDVVGSNLLVENQGGETKVESRCWDLHDGEQAAERKDSIERV